MSVLAPEPSAGPFASAMHNRTAAWGLTGAGLLALGWIAARDFVHPNPFFHPHGYCYLWEPDLVGAHVASDGFIALSYLTISVTLIYLARQTRRDIPFGWMLFAFGVFIVACGVTHAVEILTLWKPWFWLAADVKIVTAVASVATAVALPPLVPRIVGLLHAAHISEVRRRDLERVNAELQADAAERQLLQDRLESSLREKELLLKEVHHRVKNNLAVMSSLFYLQSTYTQDPALVGLLQESQHRVRSMALVHERLYGSQSLSAIDVGEYAQALAAELRSTYDARRSRVRMEIAVEPVTVGLDTAVPCGLILNELITNAFKHAFPGDRGGTIRVAVRRSDACSAVLEVIDDGIGVPKEVDPDAARSLGLRLIRSLTGQLRGQFVLRDVAPGTLARLTFPLRHDDIV